MVDVTYIDHVTSGLSLLPSQWDEKPVIRGVLESWLQPLNVVEQDALNVRDGFNVNTAIGNQLNMIGAYFDEPRGGRGDTEYRKAILSKIASSNGSGTPPELMSLYATVTNSPTVKLWEHYPLSIVLYSEGGSEADLGVPQYLKDSTGAAIEYAAIMFDPESHAWIGGEATQVFGNYIDNLGNQIITNDGDNIVVAVGYEATGEDSYKSIFVDYGFEGGSVGYGKAYGVSYGGGGKGYSNFCDIATSDNSLVTSGGNGFIKWADTSELDPETGTTNKAIPIQQYTDSGIKRGQPVPRQFFNWMMSFIDDWASFISKRNSSVGTIRSTVDLTLVAADYETRFGGTWVAIGNQTLATVPTKLFKRTA